MDCEQTFMLALNILVRDRKKRFLGSLLGVGHDGTECKYEP